MNLITDMKFIRGKMGMLTILILIITKGTDGLTWNTKMMASVCCQGTNQFLIWNFTEGENERVTELHWFFNKKTVVCYVSTSTGFRVADLYEGRVKRNGTAGILLKNVSLNDTGEYTLYVKLEEEKERNVQGFNLTVVEPPPNQCKPIIKKEHAKGIISCSTSCERSPLSLEWIINGTKGTGDIGPYFVVNSSGTSEQPICCLRDFKCLDDYQTKFCTRNNISFTEDMHTGNESVADTDHMVNPTILIILIVIQMVLIVLVILKRRRCRLFPKCHYAATDDVEIELEEPLSEKPSPILETVQELDADLKPDQIQVAVEPKHSNTVVQFNEDLQQFRTVAATAAETVNMFSKDQEPHADFNDVQVPEENYPMLPTDLEPHAGVNGFQVPEMFLAMLKKLQEVEEKLMHIQEQVPVESNRSNTGLECNEDLHQALTVAASTEKPCPIFGTVPDLDALLKPDQMQEKPCPIFGTVPDLDALLKPDQMQEKPCPIFGTVPDLDALLKPDQMQVAVKPKHSNTFAQCNEDLQQFSTVATTTDRPLQDSNQHVQIVNNISIDTDFLKSMLHSDTALMAELQASRKETRKLKRQLHPEKHLRKKENRPKYSYVTPVKCRYFKKNDTNSSETSESEDAFSELVPHEGIVSS